MTVRAVSSMRIMTEGVIDYTGVAAPIRMQHDPITDAPAR